MARGDGGAVFGQPEEVTFSASTTHALRAMAWLAAHAGGEAVLGRELARRLRREGVPARRGPWVAGALG
jgi:hypothetical protein